MNRILCLWMPQWPLQRLAQARPELDGRRIVLYEKHSRGGLRVVASSPSCVAPGSETIQRVIQPGMPLAEALALGQPQPPARPTRSAGEPRSRRGATSQLHLEAHDPWADQQALEELAEWCQRFSPLVGIEDAPQPESLLLDLTGLESLFGGEQELVGQVLRAFRQRGFSVRAALSDTVGASWALARYGDLSPFEAFSPADSRCGSTIVSPGETLAAVRSLPVAALRLSDEAIALLARLGLRRIGQVAALPRESLSSRFGPELLRRLDQALGRAAEILPTRRSPPEFVGEQLFETPTDRLDTIEAACRQLIGQVAAPLSQRQAGALRLQCRLACPPQAPVQVSVGLFRPSASARHLEELLRLQFESLRLTGPVTAVRLEVTATAPLQWRQQELFAPDRRRQATRLLAALIDRLSNRLGRQAVVRPMLVSDAQPEFACVYWPLTGGEAAGNDRSPSASRRIPNSRPKSAPRRTPQPAPLFSPGKRPLKLKREAVPLNIIALSPEGLPLRFWLGGRDQRLARCWGPERIETGWWRTGMVRRDYYRLETAAGGRFWLFRRLADGQWFVQGEFD